MLWTGNSGAASAKKAPKTVFFGHGTWQSFGAEWNHWANAGIGQVACVTPPPEGQTRGISMPLDLPDGARITKVTVYHADEDEDFNIQFHLGFTPSGGDKPLPCPHDEDGQGGGLAAPVVPAGGRSPRSPPLGGSWWHLWCPDRRLLVTTPGSGTIPDGGRGGATNGTKHRRAVHTRRTRARPSVRTCLDAIPAPSAESGAGPKGFFASVA